MTTRSRIDKLSKAICALYNDDDRCVACNQPRHQYHAYSCDLANAANLLDEMFTALDDVRSAMQPFLHGGWGTAVEKP